MVSRLEHFKREICVGLSDVERWKMLHLIARYYGCNIDLTINKRVETLQRLHKSIGPSGLVVLMVWQRDCDCVEWDELLAIEPTLLALRKAERNIFQGAEGPVWIDILTQEQVKEFRPSKRDRVLEAFENGSSYSV